MKENTDVIVVLSNFDEATNSRQGTLRGKHYCGACVDRHLW